MHDLGKGSTPPEDWPRHVAHEARSAALAEAVCRRLKIPNEVRDLAVMTAREHGNVGRALELRANTMLKLFERCDAFRKPERFLAMLQACECDHLGRTGYEHQPFPQAQHLQTGLLAAQSVNAGAIAAQVMAKSPDKAAESIAAAIHAARITAIEAAIKKANPSD